MLDKDIEVGKATRRRSEDRKEADLRKRRGRKTEMERGRRRGNGGKADAHTRDAATRDAACGQKFLYWQ